MVRSDNGTHVILGYQGLIGSAIFDTMKNSVGVSRYHYNIEGKSFEYDGDIIRLIEKFLVLKEVRFVHYCIGNLTPRNRGYIFEDLIFEPKLLFGLSEICKSKDIKFIFYSSSGALYSLPAYYQEDTEPLSYYRSTKLLSECIVNSKVENCLIVRVTNVFGRANVPKSNGVIDYIARRIAAKESIALYGSNVLYDFIHRKDLAQVVRFLIDMDETGTYNVGSGNKHSIYQIYLICKNIAFDCGVTYEYREGDKYGAEPNLSKLESFLIENSIAYSPRTIQEYLSEYVS